MCGIISSFYTMTMTLANKTIFSLNTNCKADAHEEDEDEATKIWPTVLRPVVSLRRQRHSCPREKVRVWVRKPSKRSSLVYVYVHANLQFQVTALTHTTQQFTTLNFYSPQTHERTDSSRNNLTQHFDHKIPTALCYGHFISFSVELSHNRTLSLTLFWPTFHFAFV